MSLSIYLISIMSLRTKNRQKQRKGLNRIEKERNRIEAETRGGGKKKSQTFLPPLPLCQRFVNPLNGDKDLLPSSGRSVSQLLHH